VVRLYTNSATEVTVFYDMVIVACSNAANFLFTDYLSKRGFSIQSVKQYLSLCTPHPLGVLIGIFGQYRCTKDAGAILIHLRSLADFVIETDLGNYSVSPLYSLRGGDAIAKRRRFGHDKDDFGFQLRYSTNNSKNAWKCCILVVRRQYSPNEYRLRKTLHMATMSWFGAE